MKLDYNETILFIGDSITDVDRNREDKKDLGKGYPLLTAAHLLESYPERHLTFINRGISGDKVVDLINRWKEDCIEIQPTVISLLIGINDIWHSIDKETCTIQESLDTFEFYYRILVQTAKEHTKAKIILIEPFVLKDPDEQSLWEAQLNLRLKIIRRLAKEYNTDYLELADKLKEYGNKWGNDSITNDGVHPTLAGHSLISKTWLENLEMN